MDSDWFFLLSSILKQVITKARISPGSHIRFGTARISITTERKQIQRDRFVHIFRKLLCYAFEIK